MLYTLLTFDIDSSFQSDYTRPSSSGAPALALSTKSPLEEKHHGTITSIFLSSLLTIALAHPLTNDAYSTNLSFLFGHLFSLMESQPDRLSLSHHILRSRPSQCPLPQLGEYRMCTTVNPSCWTCDHLSLTPMPFIASFFVCIPWSACTFRHISISFRVSPIFSALSSLQYSLCRWIHL